MCYDFYYAKWCLKEEILIDLLGMYFNAVVVLIVIEFLTLLKLALATLCITWVLVLLVAAQLQLTPFA